MAITFGVSGTPANGTTTAAPGYPASTQEGDYLLAIVGSGNSDNDIPTAPDGTWDLLGSAANSDGTWGNQSGPRRGTLYGKVAAGTESGSAGNFAIPTAGGNSLIVVRIERYDKTEANDWTVTAYTDNYATSEGAATHLDFGGVALATGDAAYLATGGPNASASYSGQSFSASGITFANGTERVDSGQTNGFDMRVHAWSAEVSDGAGTVDVDFDMTQDVSLGGTLVVLSDAETATGATVTPAVIAVTATVPAATPTGGAAPAPGEVAAAVSLPAAVAAAGATVAPAAAAAVASVPAVTPTGGGTVAPAAVASPSSVPAVTVTGGSVAAPGTAVAVAALPAATVTAGAGTAPDTIAATTALPAGTATTGATVTPSEVAVPVSVPAPTTGSGAVASPTAIAAPATLPLPSPTGGATTSPSVVAALAVLPAPSAGSAITTTPAAVAALVAVPASGTVTGAARAPATVAAAVSLPAPTVDDGEPDTVPLDVAHAVAVDPPRHAVELGARHAVEPDVGLAGRHRVAVGP